MAWAEPFLPIFLEVGCKKQRQQQACLLWKQPFSDSRCLLPMFSQAFLQAQKGLVSPNKLKSPRLQGLEPDKRRAYPMASF